MNPLRLYLRYVGVSVRSQMQYRASFAMTLLGHFLITGVEFLSIWAIFARFKSMAGWRMEEVAVFYAIVNIAFSLAEAVGRGFDIFPGMVRSGGFDRMLLRPRSTAFQVSAQALQLMRLGRLAQGAIILAWATGALRVPWSPAIIGLTAFAILGGACLFYGLFVLQATVSFWTTETLELMNTVTYGGTETAQFPLTVYKPWFRRFFTFVVPLACVTYFPALAILGRDDPLLHSPVWFRWTAPAVGMLFLAACLCGWRFGVRHYRSTGN